MNSAPPAHTIAAGMCVSLKTMSNQSTNSSSMRSRIRSSERTESRGADSGGRDQRGAEEELERETGFEPATAWLEARNSSTELLPLRSHSRDPASKRPVAVAVRADDIAAVDLRQDAIEVCD